jgi:Mitochondrial import 2
VGISFKMSTHSLQSLEDIDSDIFSDDELRIAQEEWDDSVAQLQLLMSTVALPIFGKWLGRRWSQRGMLQLRSLTNPH